MFLSSVYLKDNPPALLCHPPPSSSKCCISMLCDVEPDEIGSRFAPCSIQILTCPLLHLLLSLYLILIQYHHHHCREKKNAGPLSSPLISLSKEISILNLRVSTQFPCDFLQQPSRLLMVAK